MRYSSPENFPDILVHCECVGCRIDQIYPLTNRPSGFMNGKRKRKVVLVNAISVSSGKGYSMIPDTGCGISALFEEF